LKKPGHHGIYFLMQHSLKILLLPLILMTAACTGIDVNDIHPGDQKPLLPTTVVKADGNDPQQPEYSGDPAGAWMSQPEIDQLFKSAIQNGDEAAAALLIHRGASVNAKLFDGLTSLEFALLESSSPEIIELLESNGAVAAGYENVTSITLLDAYNSGAGPDDLQRLINFGADVNLSYLGGDSFLMYLLTRGESPELIQLMLDNGADVNHRNDEGFTPLMYAAAYHPLALASRLLIHAGADVMARNANGETALHLAVAEGDNVFVAITLIDAGADINAIDDDGVSVFMSAAMLGNSPDLLSLLYDRGADPLLTDFQGNSAWDYIQTNPAFSDSLIFWYLEQRDVNPGG
jgi:ankyrin repeat protein